MPTKAAEVPLADRMRERRKALDWTQYDLADHLDCNQSTVCRIEKGGAPYGPIGKLIELWLEGGEVEA